MAFSFSALCESMRISPYVGAFIIFLLIAQIVLFAVIYFKTEDPKPQTTAAQSQATTPMKSPAAKKND